MKEEEEQELTRDSSVGDVDTWKEEEDTILMGMKGFLFLPSLFF